MPLLSPKVPIFSGLGSTQIALASDFERLNYKRIPVVEIVRSVPMSHEKQVFYDMKKDVNFRYSGHHFFKYLELCHFGTN